MDQKKPFNSGEIAGKKIKEWLGFLGRDKAWLSRISGVNSGSVSQIVSGKGNPTLGTLDKLAEALGCNSTTELIDDSSKLPEHLWYLGDILSANIRRLM